MDKVLIIGCGSMGGALGKGLAQHLSKDLEICVYDINLARIDELAAAGKLTKVEDLSAGLAKTSALLLCVKPQDLGKLEKDLRGKIPNNCVVVSILAGTTLASIQTVLQHPGAAVRAMPNIAAHVGAAATALCANNSCSRLHMDLVEKIFASVGEFCWLKEDHMDAVTGLSGSGPAYIYMIIEALCDGGVKMGLPRSAAMSLAVQTVLGAAHHVKTTKEHPAVLREQVTTPGGTTIHAIHELEAHGLRAMLMKAVETATRQSAALNQVPKKN